jgi:hypothetical protein
MQKLAGNEAVSGEHAPGDGSAQQNATPLLAQTALARAENIRAAATVRLGKVAAYNSAAATAMDSYREMRTHYAANWAVGWDRHTRKLAEGNVAAARENLIEGLVIGTLAAVVITAGASAVFTGLAAAEAFSAGWWVFNVGTNSASSVIGTGAAALVGRPSVPSAVEGRRDKEADGWKKVAGAEQAARSVAGIAPKLGLELGNAEYCVAQVKAHLEGGKGADMSWDQTLSMVSTLSSWELGLGTLDAELDTKLAAMTEFGQAVRDFVVPDGADLEKQIWRAWMSTLDDETDEALDQDEIQRYLEKLELIPKTIYLTDEDQHRAVRAAKAQLANAVIPP